jgi:poly-gamma-glutamate capsule biosynthesis protein CapA/YwtB (metallophosphatase superfamily)
LPGPSGHGGGDGDTVIVSIHWGPNWGYDVPVVHRRFARRLIEEAHADIVHGHSAHHPLGVELHAGRPVLYGCGDFINDYEGISGHEEFRSELTLAWLLDYDIARAPLAFAGDDPVPACAGSASNAPAAMTPDGSPKPWTANAARFGVRVDLTADETLALAL